MRTWMALWLAGVLSAYGCSGSTETNLGGGASGAGASDGGGTCMSDAECVAPARCKFSDGTCGADQPGTCEMDGGCSTVTGPFAPVCACNGMTIGTDCINAMGNGRSFDMSACGGPPAGSFGCNGLACPIDDAYCNGYGYCRNFEDACTSCDCFDIPCAGGTCSSPPGGGLIITCP